MNSKLVHYPKNPQPGFWEEFKDFVKTVFGSRSRKKGKPPYLKGVKIRSQPELAYAAAVARELCSYGAQPAAPTDADLLIEAYVSNEHERESETSAGRTWYPKYSVVLKHVTGGSLWMRKDMSASDYQLSSIAKEEIQELARSLEASGVSRSSVSGFPLSK